MLFPRHWTINWLTSMGGGCLSASPSARDTSLFGNKKISAAEWRGTQPRLKEIPIA